MNRRRTLSIRTLAAVLVAALGAISLIVGVSVIYAPAGLIVAGVLLLAVGLLPDWEKGA